MKILELFAGTRSISKIFEEKGHETYSIEWDKQFENIDIYDDINNITAKDIIKLCGGIPDVIWASPDCTTYSIAGISYHRKQNKDTNNLDPISDYAKFCDKTNKHVLDLIQELKPKYYFIENPRGGLRKMDFMSDDEIRDFCLRKDYEIFKKDKEIKRLNNIIKEVRELLKNDYFEDGSFTNYYKVFELLDKEK